MARHQPATEDWPVGDGRSLRVRSHASVDGTLVGTAAGDRTGLLVWPGARLLLAFIARRPESVRGLRVAELGCGAGLCGVGAAALAGAARVLLTDAEPEALELARANAELNCAADRVSACVLRWGEPVPSSDFDVVLCADVVYPGTDAHALLGSAAALLAPGGEVLLAFVERDRKGVARELTAGAARAGFRWREEDWRGFAEEPPLMGARLLRLRRHSWEGADGPDGWKAAAEELFPGLWEEDAPSSSSESESEALPFWGGSGSDSDSN